MFFTSLLTICFHSILDRSFALQCESLDNFIFSLSFLGSHIQLDNCTDWPVVCEPCSMSSPVGLLLSVLHDQILHSTRELPDFGFIHATIFPAMIFSIACQMELMKRFACRVLSSFVIFYCGKSLPPWYAILYEISTSISWHAFTICPK